jgi:hypothetical protein
MFKYLVLFLCISNAYGYNNIAGEFVNDAQSENLVEADATNDFVTAVIEPHTQPFQVGSLDNK